MTRHFEACLFGITLAIAIGPIALLVLRAGMERGFMAALKCGMGAATADWIVAFSVFHVGTTLVSKIETHHRTIEAFGSGLLIAVGVWMVIRTFTHSANHTQTREKSPPDGYVATLLLTLVNPLGVTLFASFASRLGPIESVLDSFDLAVSVFLGSSIVQCGLALFGVLLHRSIADDKLLMMLSCASGMGVASFGIRGLMHVL